ncbi:ankyrin repeat domain-containing protein 31 [Carettochelys insculpta]|uniref:ankyrin repeat domain-containing protein 31 n=1 Tax=Carettochelys insculpta TaxID=44489 RepID=UPI003EBC5C56
MKEGSDISDSDSDETVVEGSVIESDLEEEELNMKRLSFVNKDILPNTETIFATEIRVNGVLGNLSPEIKLVCKFSDNLNMKEKNQVNLLVHEMSEIEQSQSLLQGAVFTTKISRPGFPLNAAVGLDTDVTGFVKTERKISRQLNVEDDAAEGSLLSNAIAQETVIEPKEWTRLNVFPGVLKERQNVSMTTTETNISIKNSSLTKFADDFILSSMSGKICREKSNVQNMTDEFEVRDLLKPLSDSESPEMINPLQGTLPCQSDTADISVDENSSVLPLELLTVLNSFSESVHPIGQVVEKQGELNEEEHLRSKVSIFQTDDCTQITDNNFESQFSVMQVDEVNALTESAFHGTLDEQLVGDQKNQDWIISDYWNDVSNDKQASEGNARSVNSISDVETTKATSCMLRRSTRLRENCTRKHTEEASRCHKTLAETQQRICNNDDKTGNKLSSKDLGTQESACKDSKEEHSELAASTYQGSTVDVNSKVEQMRKSQRIAKKITKQITAKSFSNTAPVASIPLSRINRRNLFGETLLHKAVAENDADLVCKIIKFGANVNMKDYAGWTPLHEASVAGFYKVSNELLKAGADVNCKGSDQVTPIQDAVKEGHYEVAELLLWYGADPLFQNEKGKCALDEATDQQMRKLLESYITKSRRLSTSAKKDVESVSNAQEINDTDQRQLEVHSGITVQNSDVGNNNTSEKGFINFEQSSKENAIRNVKGSISRVFQDHRLLKEKYLKDTILIPMQTKKSSGTVERIVSTENVSEYKTNISPPDSSQDKTRNRRHKTNDFYVGHNNSGFTVNTNFSKRITRSSARCNYSSDKICETRENPGITKQTKMEKECDLCNSDTSVSEAKEKACGSKEPSLITTDQVTSLLCTESSSPVIKSSTEYSENVELTELDSHSVLPLCEESCVPLVPAEQCFVNQDHEHHCLNHKKDAGMGDKNLNSAETTSGIHSIEENVIYTQNNRLPDQFLHSETSEDQIKSVSINGKVNEEEQSFKNSLQLFEDISLQGSQLEPGSLITLSPQETVNLIDSGDTVLPEEYTEKESQNIYENISKDVDNCTVQALQTSTETFSLHDFSAVVNEVSDSQSLENFSISVLTSFAHQTDEGMRMVLSAQESTGRGYNEKIADEMNSEINTATALQPREKEAFQVKRKGQALQEISLDADLYSTSFMNKDSLHPSQRTQETEQETSQETDEGRTAERSGEQSTGLCCIETNEVEGIAVNKTPIMLQILETETIQTKIIRQDPQETSQNTDLYGNYSHSPNLSQFSQTAEQEMSEQSESSLHSREEIIAAFAQPTPITRAGIKKRNSKGESRLHLAAKKGDLSLVKNLIASGVCVNLKDNAGWTALHEASNRGFTEVIVELLKAGADVNSKSLDGTLPLHDAVSGNCFKAVEILLHHGANPNEKDKYGKNALAEARNDKMEELLKAYCALDSEIAYETTEVTGPRRSRRATQTCYDCCKKADVPLVLRQNMTREKCGTHESIIATLQDIEQKQKKLLLFELRNPKDEGLYIRGLSQIQDTLNEVLAKQKAERDVLAKKYRASVESFKQGALREQLVQLASRQKSLLTVAQKQKELGHKIKKYRSAKQLYSMCSKKQIPNTVIFCERVDRNDVTVDKIVHPDVPTVSTEPSAKLTNGNLVERHLPVELNGSDQEYNQHPNGCLNEIEANEETSTSQEVSSHNLMHGNRVTECIFDKTSKSTATIEIITLPSEPVTCITRTKSSQQEKDNSVAIAVQGRKAPNSTLVTSMINISEAESFVIDNNIHQPTTERQQVLTGKTLQRYGHTNEASHKQPIIVSKSAENASLTLQQNNLHNNRTSDNATGLVSYVPDTVNISQNSSQCSDNQDSEQQQLKCRGSRRKKIRLKDLLDLGKIKPGENVLEFKLQHFSHKVTLLGDGKIRTSDNRTYGNPVQWVKALLGNDISVSWKYVWNKVTYLGTELSKILVEEACVPNESGLPSQQKQLAGMNFLGMDLGTPTFCHHNRSTSSTFQHARDCEAGNMLQKIPPLQPMEEMGIQSSLEEQAVEVSLVSRELRSKTFYLTLARKPHGKSCLQSDSTKNSTSFLQLNEIVLINNEEFLPCHIMDQHWKFYVECENFGF